MYRCVLGVVLLGGSAFAEVVLPRRDWSEVLIGLNRVRAVPAVLQADHETITGFLGYRDQPLHCARLLYGGGGAAVALSPNGDPFAGAALAGAGFLFQWLASASERHVFFYAGAPSDTDAIDKALNPLLDASQGKFLRISRAKLVRLFQPMAGRTQRRQVDGAAVTIEGFRLRVAYGFRWADSREIPVDDILVDVADGNGSTIPMRLADLRNAGLAARLREWMSRWNPFSHREIGRDLR